MAYTLGREAVQQIARLVRRSAMQTVRRHVRSDQRAVLNTAIYLALTPAGGIPAMSGSTPGSATCTLKYIDENGLVATALDSENAAITQTVYNVSSGSISGSALIQCKQECIGGALLADFENCT